MTIDEAIKILDPATTAEALAEIEYYGGFRGREAEVKACEDACIIAVDIMKRSKWIPYTEPYANARGYKGEAVCVEMDDFCSYGKRREPDDKE